MKKRIMKGIERYFTTGVGLITSTGRHGQNVMAAEWTLHISYEPMLIAVFVHEGEATYDNIMETKQFGVNMSTDEQASLVNIAGGYTRREIDKLSVRDLFKTYPARYIRAPMIKGCIINAECRMVRHYKIGDHVAFIGEVIDAKFDKTKSPLIYHRGIYRKVGKKLSSNRRQVIVGKNIFKELKSMSRNEFTLRCVAALVHNGKNELLLIRHNSKLWNSRWMVPWFVVKRGSNYKKTLERQLKEMDLDVKAGEIAGIDRVMFKCNSEHLRANFVVYRCSARNDAINDNRYLINAKWHRRIPKNVVLKGLLSFK